VETYFHDTVIRQKCLYSAVSWIYFLFPTVKTALNGKRLLDTEERDAVPLEAFLLLEKMFKG
jgi:hypothetical protein